MVHGFCEYLDIQRDYSVNPNDVKLLISDQFDLGMIPVNKWLDEQIRRYNLIGSEFFNGDRSPDFSPDRLIG